MGRLLLAGLAFLCAASASELHVSFTALERLLNEQMFREEGRRYLKGTKGDECDFAYLEKPRIRAAEGRLEIRAEFAGKSGLSLFGRCLGMGDQFPLVITAMPEYRDGAIALRDIAVESAGKDGYYIRRVVATLGEALAKEFRYPVAEEAKRAVEDPAMFPVYQRRLRRFAITGVRLTEADVVVHLDFELAVY